MQYILQRTLQHTLQQILQHALQHTSDENARFRGWQDYCAARRCHQIDLLQHTLQHTATWRRWKRSISRITRLLCCKEMSASWALWPICSCRATPSQVVAVLLQCCCSAVTGCCSFVAGCCGVAVSCRKLNVLTSLSVQGNAITGCCSVVSGCCSGLLCCCIAALNYVAMYHRAAGLHHTLKILN